MTLVSRVFGDLTPPEEIRVGEVMAYWERLGEQMPYGCYSVYRSPNRELRAWIHKKKTVIALMWNIYNGQVHQVDTAALYDLINKLGGWI